MSAVEWKAIYLCALGANSVEDRVVLGDGQSNNLFAELVTLKELAIPIEDVHLRAFI
jgi:hypothetical protein